jgi:hypothetical protein
MPDSAHMRLMKNRASLLTIALLLTGATLTGCTSTGTLAQGFKEVQTQAEKAVEGVSPSPRTSETVQVPPAAASGAAAAQAELATIEIKGRAPKTGYNREQFGQTWADVDRNGCDTRNDELKEALTDVVFKAGSDCVVVAGTLNDPYTGKTIEFVRGEKTSSAVQIDHLVPLSEAWQKGAQQWDEKTRTAFANDPINLRAVDGPSNAAKGDSDLATWMPANRAHWCTYVSEIIHVKAKYGVWMTPAEHAKAGEILAGC